MFSKVIRIVILLALTQFTTIAFAAQFLFTPRSFVRGGYTDNVFLTEDDTEDDFLTEVSAGFTAELLGRTSGLALSFDPAYVWYDQFSEKNTWRLPANLRAYTSPSRRTNLEFINTFIRTEDPEEVDRLRSERGQVEEIGDTTVRRGREPYYRNTATLRGAYQFGEQDQVYARLRYGFLRNGKIMGENQ